MIVTVVARDPPTTAITHQSLLYKHKCSVRNLRRLRFRGCSQRICQSMGSLSCAFSNSFVLLK
jgi:hypothetical protein